TAPSCRYMKIQVHQVRSAPARLQQGSTWTRRLLRVMWKSVPTILMAMARRMCFLRFAITRTRDVSVFSGTFTPVDQLPAVPLTHTRSTIFLYTLYRRRPPPTWTATASLIFSAGEVVALQVLFTFFKT